MKLDVVQQAAQEQFAKQSQLYGSGRRLAEVDDVAAALARISLPEHASIGSSREKKMRMTGAGHLSAMLIWVSTPTRRKERFVRSGKGG